MSVIRNRAIYLRGVLILLSVIAVAFSACEVDMSVSIDGKNPPTFSLSGSGNLIAFSVWEVPPEHQTQTIQRDIDGDILLWKIRPPKGNNKINSLPAITYGQVPPGFIQEFPSAGSPSALVEGKIYEVGGTAYNANGGFIWIKLQDGHTVEIPIPGSSPEVVRGKSP